MNIIFLLFLLVVLFLIRKPLIRLIKKLEIQSLNDQLDRLTNDPGYQKILKKYDIKPVDWNQTKNDPWMNGKVDSNGNLIDGKTLTKEEKEYLEQKKIREETSKQDKILEKQKKSQGKRRVNKD